MTRDPRVEAAAPGVPKICFVVSAALTAEAFLIDHIAALSRHYDVHLVANAEPAAIKHPALQRAKRHYVPIVRAISPWADIRAVAALVAVLRRERYAAVHSLTPKAGLVTALAAFIARVPVRIHTYTGQVWATRTGLSRWLLKGVDRVIATLATHVLVDSVSQRDFLRAQGVLAPQQGRVLGLGSVSGVDAGRFKPDAAARASTREGLGVAPEAIVFLFVGRLTRDKGVLDLSRVFGALAAARDDVYLFVVGPDEDAMSAALREACGAPAARLLFTGHSSEPERYMAASDVFCLPSYREGFGSVVIEAAATGLPAIGSRIYGITDAIEDGATGMLVEPRDVDALGAAMRALAENKALRNSLAAAARERALRDFSSVRLTAAVVDFYACCLAPTGAARRQAT